MEKGPIQYYSTTTATIKKTKINKNKCYLDRLFSVGFLDDTDGGVGDQNQENNNRFDKGGAGVVLLQHGEDERDTGGNKKDNNELILELFQNHLPERSGFFLGEFCFLFVSKYESEEAVVDDDEPGNDPKEKPSNKQPRRERERESNYP